MTKFMEFHDDQIFERHQCTSERKGEWIIFRCPECDYERRMNLQTGELNLIEAGNEMALHQGFHTPPGVDAANPSLN